MLTLEFESAGIADSARRRWGKNEHSRILDLSKFRPERRRNAGPAQFRVFDPLFEGGERQERCHRVIAICTIEPRESGELHGMGNPWNFASDLRYLFAHFIRSLDR